MNRYLIFALLGYITGILYAPKKGSVLRKELKECLIDIHGSGSEAAGELKRQGQEMAEKASLALGEAKDEAMTLKCQGEEIVRAASVSLYDAYDKSQSALYLAGEKAANTAAPVLSQVKEEADGLRNRLNVYFNRKKVRQIGEQTSELQAKQI